MVISGLINGGGVGLGAFFASTDFFVTFGVLIFGALEESPIWRERDRSQRSSRAPLQVLCSAP
jgi:hypothetical protein